MIGAGRVNRHGRGDEAPGSQNPANWFKGVQLVTVYVIIALMFYFLPELKP